MYRFMEQEQAQHSIRVMCRMLAVSSSGYYKWLRRKPSVRSTRDSELSRLIRQIHADSRDTYGAPRVHAELRLGRGMSCSKKRVQADA